MPSSAPSEYVTLISSDGFEFIIRREAACISGTIKRMLDPNSEFRPYLLHMYFLDRTRLSLAKEAKFYSCFFWLERGLLTLHAGNFSEALTGRCKFEEIKYVSRMSSFRGAAFFCSKFRNGARRGGYSMYVVGADVLSLL